MGFHYVTRASRGRDLIRREVAIGGGVVDSGEIVENVLLHEFVGGAPATHLYKLIIL